MFTNGLRAAGILTLAIAIAVAAVLPATATAAGVVDEVASVSPAAGNALRGSQRLLDRPTKITQSLPAIPRQALIDGTSTLSRELGYPQDVASRVNLSGISDQLAGRLANIVNALLACHRITAAHYAAIRDRIAEVARDGGGLDPRDFGDIKSCAEPLWTATAELDIAFRTGLVTAPRPLLGELDIWPVLRVAGASNSVYANDYLLLADFGGNDVYNNNAGSNMVDLNFSPAGSTVVGLRGVGPAQGCQLAIGAPGQGGLTNGDCTPTAAVLLDMQGSDTYGVLETPDIDRQCTAARVVRRMVTVGVGFLGAGVLFDSDPSTSSTDKYTGKTVSLGSGHVFGVGILRDRGGNDKYLAIRNSQGFSLIHALGLLRDEAGRDTYDFYMPSPLDPSAQNEEPGAGGVIDDEGLCDNRPRFNEGAGNLGGTGTLIEDDGNDSYRGGFTDTFGAPAGEGRGGSQGFGNNGAFGILNDRGGNDSYVIVGDQGLPVRENGTRIPPDPQCQNSTCSGGVFIDR